MNRGLIAALALSTGCNTPDPPPNTVLIDFSLNADRCADDWMLPSDCPLLCDGEIGLFVRGTGDDAVSPLIACIPFNGDAAQTLEILPQLIAQREFDVPKGTEASVQVIVYTTRDGCPLAERSATGDWSIPSQDPNQDIDTLAYAGQSPLVVFDGTMDHLVVEMECTTPPVDPIDCPVFVPQFKTSLRNLETLTYQVPVGIEMNITTAVREKTLLPPPEPPQYRLQTALPLHPVGAYFVGTANQFTFPPDCFSTLATRIGAGGAATIGSCDGDRLNEDEIEATSYDLRPAVINELLKGVGFPDGLADLPATGVIIGRVTNSSNGLEGHTVKLRNQPGTMTVRYFEQDVEGGDTFTEYPLGGSWFVITDLQIETEDGLAPCCDQLVAVDETGEPAKETKKTVGLMRGIVFGVEIFDTFTPP